MKPLLKSNKNDFLDAEAIAEAAQRPSMRFVPLKTEVHSICRPCIVYEIGSSRDGQASLTKFVPFCSSLLKRGAGYRMTLIR